MMRRHQGGPVNNKQRLTCFLSRLNSPEKIVRCSGESISMVDILFLNSQEKRALSLVDYRERCASGKENGRCVSTSFTLHEYKQDVLSLPLSIRRKLGTSCNVAVQAEQYDLKDKDCKAILRLGLGAGVLGFGACKLYGVDLKNSVCIGAGCLGTSSYLLAMLNKYKNPQANKLLIKPKPVCPEAHNPMHKLYWQTSFELLKKSCWKSPVNGQQLIGRE